MPSPGEKPICVSHALLLVSLVNANVKMLFMCPTMSIWTATISHVMFFRNIKSLSAVNFCLWSIFRNISTLPYILCTYSSHTPSASLFPGSMGTDLFHWGTQTHETNKLPHYQTLGQDACYDVETWVAVFIPKCLGRKETQKGMIWHCGFNLYFPNG